MCIRDRPKHGPPLLAPTGAITINAHGSFNGHNSKALQNFKVKMKTEVCYIL